MLPVTFSGRTVGPRTIGLSVPGPNCPGSDCPGPNCRIPICPRFNNWTSICQEPIEMTLLLVKWCDNGKGWVCAGKCKQSCKVGVKYGWVGGGCIHLCWPAHSADQLYRTRVFEAFGRWTQVHVAWIRSASMQLWSCQNWFGCFGLEYRILEV